MFSFAAFEKFATVFGVVTSSIGMAMTAEDIIDNILNPSASLEKDIADLRNDITLLGQRINDLDTSNNLRALTEALQLSRQSSDKLQDYPAISLDKQSDIMTDSFDGLDNVLNISHLILRSDPSPEEVMAVGASLTYAVLVQAQSAKIFSEGRYLGENATEHGGDREHGGHRQSSVRDNLIEAVKTLTALQDAAEAALDLSITHQSTTYYATDTSMAYKDWWTMEDDGAMIGFMRFLDGLAQSQGGTGNMLQSRQVMTFDVQFSTGADKEQVLSALEDMFGSSLQISDSTSASHDTLTAWVPSGTLVTIPAEVTGGAARQIRLNTDTMGTVARYLEKTVEQAVYDGTPLDGTGADFADMIAPLLDLVDGQMVTQSDRNDTFHGTRDSDVQRMADRNPYLSEDGDDFIVNASNIDGATLLGYGGSDYLRGGDFTDIMKGGAGNDVYFGGAGDDMLLDDNGGIDRAIYTGNAADYDITFKMVDGAYAFVIAEKPGNASVDGRGQDGVDVLRGIEIVSFDDQTIDLRHEDVELPRSFGDMLIAGVEPDQDQLIGWIGENYLWGDESNDRLVGQDMSDYIKAEGGNDLVLGNGGYDLLGGNAGNDTLLGGDGKDELVGGDGNDVLDGGAGADWMSGGNGADTFVFDSMGAEGADTITDFQSGVDRIQLDSDVFAAFGADIEADEFVHDTTGQLPAFVQAQMNFAINWLSAFDSSIAEPNLVYRDGDLFIDKNGSQSGGETLIAHFEDAPILTASDFDIV